MDTRLTMDFLIERGVCDRRQADQDARPVYGWLGRGDNEYFLFNLLIIHKIEKSCVNHSIFWHTGCFYDCHRQS